MQVIVGMTVASVRERFETILANPSAYALDMAEPGNSRKLPARPKKLLQMKQI